MFFDRTSFPTAFFPGETRLVSIGFLGLLSLVLFFALQRRGRTRFASTTRRGKPLILGFSGFAGSGKSTACVFARDLVPQGNCVELAFAKPLKDICRIAFMLSEKQVCGELKEVVDPRWNQTPRKILQFVGTDLFRNMISPNFWVSHLELRVQRLLDGKTHFPPQMIVISDVRFENEAAMLRRLGAKIVHIKRSQANPNPDEAKRHESEAGIAIALEDAVIENDGSLQAFEAKVTEVVRAAAEEAGSDILVSWR